MRIGPGLIAAFLLFSASGCALTSKADIVGIRYFSPTVARTHTTAGRTAEPRRATALLALGRVSSGANLRERIAFRDAAYEMGFYEDLRWTERPEDFVRRELARSLFEERGFQRALGGEVPTLDVEVIAFDELRAPNGRAARVQLRVVLSEDRAVILEETLTIDVPTASTAKPKIEEVVAAMAEALGTAAEQVATHVAAALAARPPTRAQ